MKKLLLVCLTIGFTASAFAGRLSCAVDDNCKYESELGYCISNVSVFKDYDEKLYIQVSKANNSGLEVLRIAARIPVQIIGKSLVGQTEDGENWANLEEVSGTLEGRLVLEEDFEFSILCGE